VLINYALLLRLPRVHTQDGEGEFSPLLGSSTQPDGVISPTTGIANQHPFNVPPDASGTGNTPGGRSEKEHALHLIVVRTANELIDISSIKMLDRLTYQEGVERGHAEWTGGEGEELRAMLAQIEARAVAAASANTSTDMSPPASHASVEELRQFLATCPRAYISLPQAAREQQQQQQRQNAVPSALVNAQADRLKLPVMLKSASIA
jgi:hypothetical protein